MSIFTSVVCIVNTNNKCRRNVQPTLNDLDHTQQSNPTNDISMSMLNVNHSHELLLDFSNFKKEECIGHGGFGTVNLCSIPPYHDRKFAVKHLNSFNRAEVNTKVEFDS